jgi:hypothetical protein
MLIDMARGLPIATEGIGTIMVATGIPSHGGMSQLSVFM